MIRQARFNKKQHVVDELVHRIESGRLVDGLPLPEEDKLAQELGVTRHTLRQALTELERRRYIATRAGGGSVVTYDGITLDQNNGWTQALADTGARIHTELLRFEAIERPELLHQFGVSQFITLDRRRRRADGTAVSLERSLMPATNGLESLPRVGLIDDSLTITLAAYGFVGERGDQWIGAEPLTVDDAQLLGLTHRALRREVRRRGRPRTS